MAKVRKANRVLEVHDSQLNSYLQRGYDQVDTKGNIVKEAVSGKNVSIAEYNKLKEDYNNLEEKTKEFAAKGKQLQEENNKLKKQLEQRKGK